MPRRCEKNKKGSKGCRSMCCGRGFVTEKKERKNCDCVYHWCCHLDCSACVEKYEEYRCR